MQNVTVIAENYLVVPQSTLPGFIRPQLNQMSWWYPFDGAVRNLSSEPILTTAITCDCQRTI